MKRLFTLALLLCPVALCFIGCDDSSTTTVAVDLQDPDLTADRIEFTIVSLDRPAAGTVRITGVIKNIGGPYNSIAGLQSIALYEDYLNSPFTGTSVATASFEDVAAGGETSVVFERFWDSSSPSEGEFPPAYHLAVFYDPTVLTDGNNRNDDLVTTNNTLSVSGSDVNGLFTP